MLWKLKGYIVLSDNICGEGRHTTQLFVSKQPLISNCFRLLQTSKKKDNAGPDRPVILKAIKFTGSGIIFIIKCAIKLIKQVKFGWQFI